MSPYTILVVDDELDLVDAIAEHFLASGWTVLQADGGHAALAALRANEVHVVLTDVRMPAGDGIELAKSALAERPRVHVYFMTGHSGLTARAAAELGAKGVVAKPFDVAKLTATMLANLGKGDA
jgi:DNA-binding NtrC family response regulator